MTSFRALSRSNKDFIKTSYVSQSSAMNGNFKFLFDIESVKRVRPVILIYVIEMETPYHTSIDVFTYFFELSVVIFPCEQCYSFVNFVYSVSISYCSTGCMG